MRPLRIPIALAFTLVGAAAVSTAGSCGGGGDPPAPDAECRFCVYQSVDNGNCPFPTCATGSNQDQCPEGCIPAPVG